MMKHGYFCKSSALAVLIALLATSAQAVDYQATATAEVVAPLTINEDQAMDFGFVFGGATLGTVVLDPDDNSRSVTGGTQALAAGPGTAAQFTISGANNATYALSFTAGSLVGPGAAMAVNGFVTETGFTPLLSATGTQTFKVGATLSVGANQTPGSYTTVGGTPYTVTFSYN